ncbi:MAG: hypothetical protein L6Q68_02530 [Aquabacterium sp.]|nr:hypothetical protein [Zoogloea sp.]MCK6431897.1 hypothetical protein [Aquabacterium sp.]
MTTVNDVLDHCGLAIGRARKRDVLAAFRAADDEGTIQATDTLRLFGPSDPRLHTCMGLATALRHLGCVDAVGKDA